MRRPEKVVADPNSSSDISGSLGVSVGGAGVIEISSY